MIFWFQPGSASIGVPSSILMVASQAAPPAGLGIMPSEVAVMAGKVPLNPLMTGATFRVGSVTSDEIVTLIGNDVMTSASLTMPSSTVFVPASVWLFVSLESTSWNLVGAFGETGSLKMT
jgi:hypothetical protein